MQLDPKKIRKHILNMAYLGQSAHIACAFSIVEILVVLLERINFNPSDPQRDYLVLSKGHGVMALYACMYEMGLLPLSDLENYFKDGSHLHGLNSATVPGIDVSTGTLGHGLPVASGLAYGLMRSRSARQVYCIVGDGEMNEGSCWEAVMFAAHHKLNNLTLIVDSNRLQAMGKTRDVLDMGDMAKKLHAFGFGTFNCDGNDTSRVAAALDWDRNLYPKGIIAHTTKGSGVSWMEDVNEWHYRRLTPETYEKAMLDLA